MSTGHANQQVFTAQAVAAMSPQHVAQLLQSKASTIATLQHQLDWFKRQLFGKKSERFAPEPDPQQMHLGQLLGEIPAAPEQPEAGSTVPAHTRRKPSRDFADESRDAPFFDEAVVPVQTIEVPSPEAQGLAPSSTRSSARRSATGWRSARAASSSSNTCAPSSSVWTRRPCIARRRRWASSRAVAPM